MAAKAMSQAKRAEDAKKIAAALHARMDALEDRVEAAVTGEVTVVHGWTEKHVGILCLAVAVAFFFAGIGIGTHFG